MYFVSLHGHLTSCWPRSRGAPTECSAGTHSVSPSSRRSLHLGTHARHDVHRGDDVGAVGDLDAQLRVLGVHGPHAERDDVHRPTAHAAAVELRHRGLHLGRVHPVVGDPRVGLVDRADEGALLDARDVVGVGGGVERVRLLGRVEPDVGPGLDELGGEPVPLVLGPVAPHDPVGRGEVRDLVHPVEHLTASDRRVVESLDGRNGSHASPRSLDRRTPRPRSGPVASGTEAPPDTATCPGSASDGGLRR